MHVVMERRPTKGFFCNEVLPRMDQSLIRASAPGPIESIPHSWYLCHHIDEAFRQIAMPIRRQATTKTNGTVRRRCEGRTCPSRSG